MINKILIGNVASFTEEVEMKPNKLNFMFGANGSGKTTLSNCIQNYKSCESIEMDFAVDSERTFFVYNKPYVEKTFSFDSEVPGIFTLGEATREIKDEISEKQKKIIKKEEELVKLNSNIKNDEKEIAKLKNNFEDLAWKIKSKHQTNFPEIFKNNIGSKIIFGNKILCEYEKYLKKKTQTDFEIIKLHDTFDLYIKSFEQNIELKNPIVELMHSTKNIIENEIWDEVIVGKSNSEVAKLISKLENSDWVRKGLDYLKESNQTCPFCQQIMSESLNEEISSFFDEQYIEKCKLIEDLNKEYLAESKNNLIDANNILKTEVNGFDYTEIEKATQKLENCIKKNKNQIEKKIDYPSKKIILDSEIAIITEINAEIKKINKYIDRNNNIVKYTEKHKEKCNDDFWNYTVDEIKDTIITYKNNKNPLKKRILGVKETQKKTEICLKELVVEVEELNEKLTSVQPTVSAINRLLIEFGFTNFKLAEAEKSTYKVVRPHGNEDNILETLSEGEYTFITFLYFFHSVYGSISSKGNQNPKIVIIDDPVSSLDSNILFIVNYLVKKIISNCRENKKNIRQVFVLTHNIYFYKEVTYLGSRDKYKENEAAFWIIKKTKDISSIIKYDTNPISTSYELLWNNIRDKYDESTVFNSMRRVLEHYFNVIGGLNYEDCIDKFSGEDKILCKSLLMLINDGSHTVFDDLIMHTDSEMLEKYIQVFKKIFMNENQEGHYDMMMDKND